jgi:hypothetical protein
MAGWDAHGINIYKRGSVVTIKKVGGAGRALASPRQQQQRAFIAKHNFELMWPLLPQLYEQPLVGARTCPLQ